MTKRELLISEIEAFCRAKRLSEREFGEIAVGLTRMMPRLRRGTIASRTMDTIDHFLVAHADSPPFALKVQLLAERAALREAAMHDMTGLAAA